MSFFRGLVLMPLLLGYADAQQAPPEELFVPIMINGMVSDNFHFQTLFRFVELSGTTASPAVTIQVDAFDNEGNVIDPVRLFCDVWPTIPAPRTLSGFGATHFGTKGYDTFGYPSDAFIGIVDGWVRIRYAGPGEMGVAAEIAAVRAPAAQCPNVPICSRPSSEYESDALVQAMRPSRAFRIPTVVTPERQAAFSIVNPSSAEESRVRMKFYGSDGVMLGEVGFKIPPMHRMSHFASEFANIPPEVVGIPEPWALPERYYGSVLVTADTPIVVGALQILFPEGKFVASSVTSLN